MSLLRVHTHYLRFPTRASAYSWFDSLFSCIRTQTQCQTRQEQSEVEAADAATSVLDAATVVAVVGADTLRCWTGSLLTSSDDVWHSPWCHTTFDQTCILDSLYMLLR